MKKNEAVFKKDQDTNTINMVRTFDASLDQVWLAWTDGDMLEKWWAPRPYKAVTRQMDFREGGFWHYCMMGPQGDNSWCLESFSTIQPKELIMNKVNFCDGERQIDNSFPTMHWTKKFDENGDETIVTVDIKFESREDMDKIVAMGMQGGFTMGMNNLDELLAEKAK